MKESQSEPGKIKIMLMGTENGASCCLGWSCDEWRYHGNRNFFKGRKTFGEMKIMLIIRNVSMGVKKNLFGRTVVWTVNYGTKNWGIRMDERCMLDAVEVKCLQSECVVTSMDWCRNDAVNCRVGARKKSNEWVDEKVLKFHSSHCIYYPCDVSI